MSLQDKDLLFSGNGFQLFTDGLKQVGLTAELTAPDCLQITTEAGTRCVHIPPPARGSVGYRGDIPLLTAVYNMALHELQQNITPEGLLLAGASWSTVWTRDIAYAAALGADLAEPEATKRSLASRVREGIILQDTGTGGGWPVSTDRVSWALGAWALYLSTGDKDWLHFSIEALQNTMEQDAAVLPEGEMIPGESSFLDWREQSYPEWMTPAQIGASYAFGTNVLHYMSRRLLSRMLSEVGRKDEAETYAEQAAKLAPAIEKGFWNEAAQRYDMLTTAEGCPEERTDALATAIAVLCGLAGDHAEQALQAIPRSPYGTPAFSPYKSSVPAAYHNRAIWPFTEAFVLLAHAELQDMQGVAFSMASLLRAALAFGTNKENFNATTGRAEDTVQNSDRQLWSVSGMLGLFYHGLLGIQYEHDNLVFNPCIPENFAGSHWFTGLRIRNMVLDVHLNGYGTEICSVMINGKAGSPLIPLDTEGHVQVELELLPPDGAAQQAYSFPPADEDLPAPEWSSDATSTLAWKPVPGATHYHLYANGSFVLSTEKLSYSPTLTPRTFYTLYHLRALNSHTASALSAPLEYTAPGARNTLQPCTVGEQAEYPVEHGQAWLDTRPCTAQLDYEPVVLAKGTYLVRICYSNATASRRDGDTCALRELFADGAPAALIPLPHNTEQGHWDDYSYSAPVKLELEAGEHTLSLRYTPACANANLHINQCMVRHLELTRIG